MSEWERTSANLLVHAHNLVNKCWHSHAFNEFMSSCRFKLYVISLLVFFFSPEMWHYMWQNSTQAQMVIFGPLVLRVFCDVVIERDKILPSDCVHKTWANIIFPILWILYKMNLLYIVSVLSCLLAAFVYDDEVRTDSVGFNDCLFWERAKRRHWERDTANHKFL